MSINPEVASLKGTPIVTVRSLLKEKDEAVEKKFLESLTPNETDIYKNALAVTWYPAEITASIFKKAAAVMFPGDFQGLRKLGKFMGTKDFSSGLQK